MYFSRKNENFVNGKITNLEIGNTKVVANKLHEKVRGTMIELIPIQAYPKEYHKMLQISQKEKEHEIRPPYHAIDEERLKEAQDIFLGFPNWDGSFPRIIAHFLEEHDLSGKIIYPFCTHEGSAFGRSIIELQKLCPHAIIKDGLPYRGSRIEKVEAAIDNWLVQYKLSGGINDGKT